MVSSQMSFFRDGKDILRDNMDENHEMIVRLMLQLIFCLVVEAESNE